MLYNFELRYRCKILLFNEGNTCPSFKTASLYLPLVCDRVCGLSVLGFDKVPWWGTLLISIGFSLLTAVVVWFIVCPHLKKKIESKLYYLI